MVQRPRTAGLRSGRSGHIDPLPWSGTRGTPALFGTAVDPPGGQGLKPVRTDDPRAVQLLAHPTRRASPLLLSVAFIRRLKPRSELLLLYVGLGIIYVFLLVFLGVKTIRNGRWILFILGFFIPLLWIIGGILPPKGMSRVDEAYARRDQAE